MSFLKSLFNVFSMILKLAFGPRSNLKKLDKSKDEFSENLEIVSVKTLAEQFGLFLTSEVLNVFETFTPRQREIFRTMLILRFNLEKDQREIAVFEERLNDPADGLDRYDEYLYRNLKDRVFLNGEEMTLLQFSHPKIWELVETIPYLGWSIEVGKSN